MKNIIALSLYLLMAITLCAQESGKPVTPAKYVREFMPQEKLEVYITDRPQKLLDMNYYSQNYCYVTDQIPENSQVIASLVSTVKGAFTCDHAQILRDKEINPFRFNLLQDNTKNNIYTIENSKFVVVVRPLTEYEKGKADYFKQYGY
jgi:hypothetical protein